MRSSQTAYAHQARPQRRADKPCATAPLSQPFQTRSRRTLARALRPIALRHAMPMSNHHVLAPDCPPFCAPAQLRRVIRATAERLVDAWRLQQEQPPPLQAKGSTGGLPPVLETKASSNGHPLLPRTSSIGGQPPLLQPMGSIGGQPPLLQPKGSIGGLPPVLETKVSSDGHPLLPTKASVGASKVLQRNGSSIGRGTPVGTGGLLRSLSRALTRARSRLGRTRSGRVRGVAPGSFIGLMQEAKDKTTKAGLTEEEVSGLGGAHVAVLGRADVGVHGLVGFGLHALGCELLATGLAYRCCGPQCESTPQQHQYRD